MPGAADLILRALHYAQHLGTAGNEHSIHSPFLFEFYNEVVRFPYAFDIYERLEAERLNLLQDSAFIDFLEAGAGSKRGRRKISEIAGSSLMPFFKASFLLRLCHWLKPKTCIELGTSLGLTSAYLALGGAGKLISFEASESVAARARTVWENLAITNIQLIPGKIEDTLPKILLDPEASWNLAIVDANHRFESTMNYFQLLKSKAEADSCMVFDDIYWSREMSAAWNKIRQDPSVRISVDLFHFGIVFFRAESSKQHFRLRW